MGVDMINQRIANLIFVVITLGACAYFAWVAQGFVTSGLLASSGLPSKFFPQLTLGIIAACTLIAGFQYLTKGEAGGDKGEMVFESLGEGTKGILTLIVMVGCYYIWKHFGFVAMAVVLGPLSLLAMGVRNPMYYAIIWVLTALVYVVFTYGLNIRLV